MSRKIDKIIIHCSATRPSTKCDVSTITQWHKARGFSTIGYHYVISRDGGIHVGRDEAVVGAHCKGQNAHSIGVCYVGGLNEKSGKPEDNRTPEQRLSMLHLLVELKRKYPGATIHGHREFAKKDCPCFDAKKEYEKI